MPSSGWKTVAVDEVLYDRLVALAGELDRPVNWTARKALEHVVYSVMRREKDGASTFDPVTAEEMGLR